MNYLMESENELARLVAQARQDPVRERLLGAGLSPGQSALDAGCGPGVVSEVIAEIVGPSGRVLGVDASAERIREATARAGGRPNARFETGDLRQLAAADQTFDFVWSQFVFEYLRDPAAALAELVRVTRRGGKVVVCDVDGAGLACWPFPPEVEAGLRRAFDFLETATGFDVHVGRKMFSHFRAAGLTDVRVKVYPFYVAAGAADERLRKDWEIRFDAAEGVGAAALGGTSAWRGLRDQYLALLNDPGTLKYAVVLVTEGVRP